VSDPTRYRPSHLGLCVSELERSLRFYCDGLGFEPAEGLDLSDADLPGLDRALEVPGPVDVRASLMPRLLQAARTARATRSVPKAVRMARYRSPVAAMTAE
jgi:catechol 2,3-dioxygenase-like lactoylglutathione lyase family enzyme